MALARQSRKREREQPDYPSCSQHAHDKTVLRPMRAVKDNLAAPPKCDEQAWKEYVYRSTRAIRDSWGLPLKMIEEKRKELRVN